MSQKNHRGSIIKKILAIIGVTVGIFVIVVAILLGLFFKSPLEADITRRAQDRTIGVGSAIRSYRVYTPKTLAQNPGLIIALQPTAGNGVVMEALSNLDQQADRLGWVVAYPNAAKEGWTANGCCGQNDDVQFISRLIDRLETDKALDPKKVYVTGFSRGGMLTYRLGCELSSKITAIAPVEGNMAGINGNVDAANCHPTRPVSVLAIHGTDDSEILVAGGKSKVNPDESVVYAPLDTVIKKWRDIDGCSSVQQPTITGRTTTSSWSCSSGSEVKLAMLAGGDHNWPGSASGFVLFVDKTSGLPAPLSAESSLDASRLVADFFVKHST